MATTLAARTAGKVAQYGIDSANVKPYDSGNILGTVPPGKAGIKLIDGTVQNATDLTTDGTAGVANWLACTSGVGVDPTVNSAQIESNGLSLAPQTE
jgi:hypothetical protein